MPQKLDWLGSSAKKGVSAIERSDFVLSAAAYLKHPCHFILYR
jgi:hypothetical protein